MHVQVASWKAARATQVNASIWDAEQDQQLRTAIVDPPKKPSGAIDWTVIAAGVRDRSNSQCYRRWATRLSHPDRGSSSKRKRVHPPLPSTPVPPIPRATDEEFDDPELMDSSDDEDALPPPPPPQPNRMGVDASLAPLAPGVYKVVWPVQRRAERELPHDVARLLGPETVLTVAQAMRLHASGTVRRCYEGGWMARSQQVRTAALFLAHTHLHAHRPDLVAVGLPPPLDLRAYGLAVGMPDENKGQQATAARVQRNIEKAAAVGVRDGAVKPEC